MELSELCKQSTPDFFTQQLHVKEYPNHTWDYCTDLCKDKTVLHVGCSDWPIFNPATSLHLHLAKHCRLLYGLDPNGTDELKKHLPNSKYFDDTHHIEWSYGGNFRADVILIPNVLEHVRDAEYFLEKLFEIQHKEMFILVPNYKISEQGVYENGIFTEKVHPDHYCWYSPYTLLNTVKPFIDSTKKEAELLFFDNQSMIGIRIYDKT